MYNAAKEISENLNYIYIDVENLETNIDKKQAHLFKRELKNDKIDNKLAYLVEKQNNVIYFNISGKLFPCDKNVILNCEYKNMLTELLKNLIQNKKEEDLKDILLDINKKSFKSILEIIRKKDDKRLKVSEYFELNSKMNIQLKSSLSPVVFYNDLQFIFKDIALENIFEDFKIIYTENTKNHLLYGPNMNLTQFVTLFEVSAWYPNELHTPYKAETMEDITRVDFGMKAIFVDYDSNIIFNFSEPVKMKKIELRPFWCDLDVWYPGDGASCVIYYSKDKVTWDFLTMVPDIYGCDMDMVHVMEFEEKECQYLKIETKEYGLSVAYIKVS